MGQIKISYRTLNGSESTGYVEEFPDEHGLHHGTNKHSDTPLSVLATNHGWEELDTPEYREAQAAWWADTRNWF